MSTRRFFSQSPHLITRSAQPPLQQSRNRHAGFFPTSTQQPLLEVMCHKYLPLDRHYPYILGFMHHLFPSFLPLADALSQRMPLYLLGKSYSSPPKALNLLAKQPNIHMTPNSPQLRYGGFNNAFRHDVGSFLTSIEQRLEQSPELKGAIILDHGGGALAEINLNFAKKHRIIAIEHTTNGIKDPEAQGAPLNVIELASAAVKRKLESTVIGQEVCKGLAIALGCSKLPQDKIYGVIGFGAVGQKISQQLAAQGCKVVVYDNKDNLTAEHFHQFEFVSGLEALLCRAHIVISSTGEDVSLGDNFRLFDRAHQDLTLASASSGDTEFRYLALKHQAQNKAPDFRFRPFQPFRYRNTMGHYLTVLNAGNPINMLDPSLFPSGYNELSSPEAIAITRAAMPAVISQAIGLMEKGPEVFSAPKNYMFDPARQKHLAQAWLATQPVSDYDPLIRQRFQDEEWIAKHSGQGFQDNVCDHLQQPNLSVR